jgi:hypothetical protein
VQRVSQIGGARRKDNVAAHADARKRIIAVQRRSESAAKARRKGGGRGVRVVVVFRLRLARSAARISSTDEPSLSADAAAPAAPRGVTSRPPPAGPRSHQVARIHEPVEPLAEPPPRDARDASRRAREPPHSQPRRRGLGPQDPACATGGVTAHGPAPPLHGVARGCFGAVCYISRVDVLQSCKGSLSRDTFLC